MTRPPLVGGLEAGGTKFVCAIGTGPDDVRSLARFPTDTSGRPETTVDACLAWFRDEQARLGLRIAALGVGSFGPVDLRAQRITTTPKPGWAGYPLGDQLRAGLEVPIGFDTDVNAAALGEHRWGHGRDHDPLVYVTIGTGIGAGAVVNGALLHGALHPEVGHILLAREPSDRFAGVCPFHGACWEGLCSGPAIAARAGQPAEALPAAHPAWALQARYVAQALYTLVCVLSPTRVIVGGSVARGGAQAEGALLAAIRRELVAVAGGYLALPSLADLDRYLVAPGLGDRAGVLGAFALAHDALAP